MQFRLLDGRFDARDALHILTALVEVKIRFHEGKVTQTSSEEEITMREQRIRQLQQDLRDARRHIEQREGSIDLSADVHL